MKNYVINNGAFTTAGNFSGYTALGERVHFFKRQMEALGWTSNEDVKFPFYAIAAIKTINRVDANNVATGETDERLTALSAFKAKADILQAHADASLLDVEIAQAVRTQAADAGLSEAQIDALSAVTF